MELLYIWIENYKNIKEQGFNFSPEYRFDFNFNHNELTLNITKNPNYIDNFFPVGISNVTAIIGENGAGKTNLLEIIWNIKNNLKDFGKFIVIYTDAIYHSEKMNVEIIDETNQNWESKRHKVKDRKSIKEEFPIVFYSNNFDDFHDKMNSLDISNIQTLTYSLYNNQRSVKEKLSYTYAYKRYNDVNLFSMLKFIVDFGKINRQKKIQLLSEIPVYFNLFINWDLTLIIPQSYAKKGNRNFIDMLYEKILDIFFRIFTNDTNEEEIIKAKYNDIIKDFPNKENVKQFCKEIIDKDYESYSKSHKNYINSFFYKELFFQYLNTTLPKIEKYIEENPKMIDNSSITIRLNEENNKFIFEIVETGFLFSIFSYRFENNKKEIIDFSSGEVNILNIYSRFYGVLKEIIYPSENGKSIIPIAGVDKILVLIDEGENTLHPDWQKRFIKLLMDFFRIIFGEIKLNNFVSQKKDVQIILTSHSPFLVSDLPNDNIIFLERDKTTGNCIVKDSLNDMKHTFGANIHTLLTDSFFMKGGLMGDFAKEKINEVIDDLISRGVVSEKRQKEIRNIINAVGDDIIKRKLMQMFQDKFNLDIDARISHLEQEINNLKQQKNNDTNTE